MIRLLRNPHTRKKLYLLSMDSAIITLLFALSYVFRITVIEQNSLSITFERLSWLLPVGVILHLLTFYVFDLYNIEDRKPLKMTFLQVALSVTVASWMLAVISYAFPGYKFGRIVLFTHLLLTIVILSAWRFVFFSQNQKQNPSRNLLIIGNGAICGEITDILKNSPINFYNYTGCITKYSKNPGCVLEGQICEKTLYDLAMDKKINTIVVADNIRQEDTLREELMRLKFEGISIYDAAVFYKELNNKVPVSHINYTWFLFYNQGEEFMPAYWKNLKRIMDMFFGCFFLLAFSPVFIIAAIAIKFESKGPVLFKQERLGLNGKYFTAYKFRTMVNDAEKMTGPKWSSVDDPRITRVGRILRKTRLDEIPQFINIVRGEMSLVGPRPIREHFATILAEKFPFYRLRFLVKPGLTGWAQVKGDYAGSEEGQFEKLQYDLYYVQNQSLLLDFLIMLKTVQTVLFQRGQ